MREPSVEEAHDYARELLGDMPSRWAHTVAVANRAAQLVTELGLEASEGDLLVAAAWLHDVGYAAKSGTGCHHLDGADMLRAAGYDRVASLVAYHSSGAQEATLRDLGDQLADYEVECSLIADALTVADLTVGPDGRRTDLEQRIAEVVSRYGADHVVSRGLQRALPDLQASFSRVQATTCQPM